MKKTILKSKAMLITLASILLVSCGGGGGGGSSSNLPINPGNNKNLSQLKNEYAEARKKSTETIPTDSREEDGKVNGVYKGKIEGKNIKVAIIDDDFLTNKNSLESKFPGIKILPRIDGKTSTGGDGKVVLDILRGEGFLDDDYKNKINVIAASIEDEAADEYNFTKEIQDRVINEFGNQKIKIVNQPLLSEESYTKYKGKESDILNETFDGSSDKIVPYFKDIVNNKGGLYVWAAGDNDVTDKSSATVGAGLPYFEHELEKGWISVVGVDYAEGYKFTNPDGTLNIKKDSSGNPILDKDGDPIPNIPKNARYYIAGKGTDQLAYAGPEAKWWTISAPSNYFKEHPTINNKFIEVSSSVIAAPRVTRTAALVAEKFDWMTPDQVRQTLFTTTDKMELTKDPESLSENETRNIITTPSDKYGWGMANPDRALKGPGVFQRTNLYTNNSVFAANVPLGTESYFENNIYGAGGLDKLGKGKLHLTGDNSYAGGSIVNDGELHIHKVHSSPIRVDKNGTLVLHSRAIVGYDISSNQIITNVDPQKITSEGTKINNFGTVNFTGTTAIIGGDYFAHKGSTTQVGFRSNVKVLGNIKIEDGTVSVLSNDYVTKNEKSTIMEGKSVQGSISNVETNGMRNANVEVQDGKVVATLSRQNPVEYIGENAEASSKNVAENVEKVFKDLDQKVLSGTATKEELAMGATVQKMSTMGFTSATEMMSGEIYASAQALTFSQAQNVNRDLSNRLAGLDNFKNSNKDSEVWFSVLGSGGKLRRDGYASADTRVTGGQFGIDTKFNPTTTLGVAMNYSYAKANFNRYAGESKSNMVGVSFYAKQDLPYGFYTAGRLGLSNISSKVERELLTSTGDTVTGKINHHDKMLSAYVEIGKKIGWFTPFIGYSQDYLRRGSFNESEASWGVKADSKNYRATNFLVGARVEYVGDKYKLQAYVTQAINTDKRDLSYEGRFTGSSVKQKFYGVKQAKNTTWIGFGAFREISPVFGIYGNVDFRVEDKKWADSVISTGLQYRF